MPVGPRALTLAAGLAAMLPLSAAAQDLLGHGGPVGALALDGTRAVSGGFDTRAILWDLQTGTAQAVTRFHDGNVTAVAFLSGGGFVSAGQDGRMALWDPGDKEPASATPHGVSAISALAVAPDGKRLAAGFRDGTILTLDLRSGETAQVRAHSDRVTGLGYLASGDLVSVGSDMRFARWSMELTRAARADLPELPNGLAISQERAAVVFADGALRLLSADGALLPERFLADRPLVSVAASADGIAAGGIDGMVWMLDPPTLTERFRIQAASSPIWAVATDGEVLLSAGSDGAIRRWSAQDGAAKGTASEVAADDFDDGSRGAEVWRACAVCHSLAPGDHSRAGPSLHGIFGQRIATQPGFDFSDAMRKLDIVWTPRTVSELFEFGPEAYTPGSRMPEQRISSAEDRHALMEFLERVSR